MKRQPISSSIIGKLRLLISVFILTYPVIRSAADELISVEDFFRNAQFSRFEISPDGETLAAIGEWENSRNLFVWDIASMQGRRLTGYKQNNVSGVMWANNERILYFMDKDGNESLGIFAINKDGKRPRTLVEPQEGRVGGVASIRRTMILDVLVDEPSRVLVTNNDRLLDYPDVFHMDVMSGSLGVLLRNPGDIVGWLPDWDGVVRLAVFSNRELEKTGVRYRKCESSDWELLAEFGIDAPGWSPLSFSPDGKMLYVASNLEDDLSAVYEFDLEQRKIGRRVFHHPRVDVSGLLFSRFHRAVIGAIASAEKPEVRWFSQEKQELQSLLDRTFPDTVNMLSNASLDETRVVVSSFSDRQSPKFSLVDFRGEQLRLIPRVKPVHG
jgi:dipeptidyl aminopeptidase/acylaminoacyl peptidase